MPDKIENFKNKTRQVQLCLWNQTIQSGRLESGRYVYTSQFDLW